MHSTHAVRHGRFRLLLGMLAAAVLAIVLALPVSAYAETEKAWTVNGGTSYDTLAEAITAAGNEESTITLNVAEYVGDGAKAKSGQNITIDLQGNSFTIDGTVGSTGTATNGFQFLKGSTVTIKNGTVYVGKAYRIIQSYCDLKLIDVTLDASENVNPCVLAVSLCNGNVEILGSTSIIAAEGQGSFGLYYWPNGGYTGGVSVKVDTTGTLEGCVWFGSDGTSSGLSGVAEKAKLVIDNGVFDGPLYTRNLGGTDANIIVNGGTFKSGFTSADTEGYSDPDANDDTETFDGYTNYIAQTSAAHTVDGETLVHDEPSYNEPVESWAADNSKVTVTQECSICGHVETIADAESGVVVDKLPTTAEEGSYLYSAEVKLESGTYTAKTYVAIPKIGADIDDETTANSDDALHASLNALISSGEASDDLKAAVIAAATSGEPLEVKAVVDEVEPDDAELITKALEEIGLTAGPAYDVTIKVFDSKDREVAELSELTDKVYVGLDISELPAAEKGKVRDFTVVRVHDSAVTVIDENDTYVSEDGKTLYVASDKFSGYGVGYEDVDPTPVTMYRLYNPNSGEHFYTGDAVEKNVLVTVGWKYEGVAWTAPSASTTPVYRLYSGADHHYTTSVVERDYLVSVGWTNEGIGWYSDDLEGVAIYRQFNPNVDPAALRNNSGSHNYTADRAENDALVSLGWTAEGIGWYGMADELAED